MRRAKSRAAQARRNNPGKRRARKSSPPTAQPDVSAPPDWLGPVAKQNWRRLVPVLCRHGVLGELDVDALTLYCDAWQQLHDADEILRDGEFVTTESGAVYQHPAMSKRHRAIDRLRKIGEQLGLTPNSRRGLEIAGQGEMLAAFLAKKPP